MKKTKNISIVLMVAAGLTALVLAGCGTARPKAWNLNINKSTSASIEVDLVGVTDSEKPYWEGYNIDKYWSEGDLRRKNAKPLTQILKMGQPWTISETNAQWQAWLDRGDTELLIIANLPGHFEAGPADPRRLFLPLNGVWKAKNHTLDIEVQDTMILVLTPQKTK